MDSALIAFERAFDLVNSNKNGTDKNKLVLCHNNLANFHLLNSQFDKALSHLIDSKDLVEEIYGDAHVKLIQPLLKLANIYNQSIRDYESAQSLFFKILGILNDENEPIKNVKIRMECFEGLSHSYLCHQRDYEKSLKYLEKQMECIEDEDEMKIIDVLLDKVAVFLAQNDYVSAWSILKRILTMFENGNNERMNDDKLMKTFNTCGKVMFELNRQNEAISFYEKELELIKSTNSEKKKEERKSTAELIELLAMLHFGNQNLEKSKKYFQNEN